MYYRCDSQNPIAMQSKKILLNNIHMPSIHKICARAHFLQHTALSWSFTRKEKKSKDQKNACCAVLDTCNVGWVQASQRPKKTRIISYDCKCRKSLIETMCSEHKHVHAVANTMWNWQLELGNWQNILFLCDDRIFSPAWLFFYIRSAFGLATKAIFIHMSSRYEILMRFFFFGVYFFFEP